MPLGNCLLSKATQAVKQPCQLMAINLGKQQTMKRLLIALALLTASMPASSAQTTATAPWRSGKPIPPAVPATPSASAQPSNWLDAACPNKEPVEAWRQCAMAAVTAKAEARENTFSEQVAQQQLQAEYQRQLLQQQAEYQRQLLQRRPTTSPTRIGSMPSKTTGGIKSKPLL